MALSTAWDDNQGWSPWPEHLIPWAGSNSFASQSGNSSDMDGTVKFAVPLILDQTHTIDLVEMEVNSGTAADVTCRIETESSTTGEPSGTLVHANATDTLSSVGGSAATLTFDFTNFSLSAGIYWMVVSSSGGDINIYYTPDWGGSSYKYGGKRMVYYDGADWDNDVNLPLLIRCKNADGEWLNAAKYMQIQHGMLQGTGTSHVMDSLENPDCRGFGFVAPWNGYINGIVGTPGNFPSNTSCEMVILNKSDLSTVLHRVEIFQEEMQAATQMMMMPFDDRVELTAGDTYYVYFIHGSQATTSSGIRLYQIDLHAVTTNDLQYLGYDMADGDHFMIYAHDPVAEGGVGTWTEDHTKTYGFGVNYCQIEEAAASSSAQSVFGGFST